MYVHNKGAKEENIPLTKPLTALAYVTTPQNPSYLGPAPEEVIATQILACRGFSGHNLEYLLCLADFRSTSADHLHRSDMTHSGPGPAQSVITSTVPHRRATASSSRTHVKWLSYASCCAELGIEAWVRRHGVLSSAAPAPQVKGEEVHIGQMLRGKVCLCGSDRRTQNYALVLLKNDCLLSTTAPASRLGKDEPYSCKLDKEPEMQSGGWSTMDHTGAIDTEEELGPLAHLAPSPQSEAVAHEFQELSLQSSQHLPPLNERKNAVVNKVAVSMEEPVSEEELVHLLGCSSGIALYSEGLPQRNVGVMYW
ncbi:hypothetical protein U0070_020909 [Myodes glareolus]|uniref:Gamma-glutamylcyclotransferase n=1 Tax=Myodes glareolus TaxID=447135 RepID=A0AAW0HAN2_MYOGA